MLAVMAVFFAGCESPFSVSDENNTDFSAQGEKQVSLTLNTNGANGIATVSSMSNAAANDISVDSAKILVRELKFHTDDEDETEEFRTESFVMRLTPGTIANEVAVNNIPFGVYDKVSFKIHKPEGDETPPDPDFKEGDSGQERFSVIVFGNYNGESFTYRSNKSFQQKVELNPDLVIDENSAPEINVALSVNLNTWFIDRNGNQLNPFDENNESKIDKTIRDSFRAFKDDDRDGEKDEDEGEESNRDTDDDGEDDESEIEISFTNTGEDPDASGKAEYESDEDRSEFEVEVEDLDAGTYDLVVGDSTVGEIQVVVDDDGTEGEIEFRNPLGDDNDKQLLDFDPRGQTITIEQGGVVFLQADFPEGSAGNRDDDDEDSDDDGNGDDGDDDSDDNSDDDGNGDDGDDDSDDNSDDDGNGDDGDDDSDDNSGDDGNGDEGDDDSDDNSGDDGNGDEGDDDSDDNSENEIEKSFTNTGLDADASGEAEFEIEEDRTEFKVEVEDLDIGTYDLLVGGELKAQIEVIEVDGGSEGEVEFRNPLGEDDDKLLLDFDPRGKTIEVANGSDIFLTVDF